MANFICRLCGKPYKRPPNRSKETAFCSRSCQSKNKSASNHASWEGGIFIVNPSGTNTRGFIRERVSNGNYVPQHRLIASKAIGRSLFSWEVIMHLDDDNLNNDPSNLFICHSRRQFVKFHTNVWPRPTASNLHTYGRND